MTDRDYADLINPYVRAEEEAEQRGRRQGWCEGAFVTILAILSLVAVFYTVETRADVLLNWKFVIAEAPINASDCGTRVSVCHNSSAYHPWHCHCPRSK